MQRRSIGTLIIGTTSEFPILMLPQVCRISRDFSLQDFMDDDRVKEGCIVIEYRN